MKLGFLAKLGLGALIPELRKWLRERAIHVPEKRLVEIHTKHVAPLKGLVTATEELLTVAKALKIDQKAIDKVQAAVTAVKPVVNDHTMWREVELELVEAIVKEIEGVAVKL